jgi:tetratricopeptide (TPR) repeat protein
MIGSLLNERYRLDAELGRGSMGVVYRARDALLDRDVAIKVLSNSRLGTEGRARLLREARAAARLDHPNIVTVYDAGESDGAPFIVMQLVDGASLHERPPPDIDKIISIAKQLCAALEHANEHSIVHRDLKPENVIVTPDGAVKLMDFGLARSVASRITSEGAIVGTVFYLAPEQALGGEVDGRADLYALGVMLYEWTTGRLPFTADDPVAVISQHLHAPIVPPRAHSEGIPPALDTLIVRLMSKIPEDRPASANEVLQTLERLTSSEADVEVTAELSLLDTVVRGRMVGRGGELTALREHWMQAGQGRGGMVLISGEPGIGKTRLANELIAYVRLHGGLVLQGGCYEYEAATPYLPLAEALRDWVHAQTTETLRDQLASTAAELAKLAPEIEAQLGPLAPNPPLPADQERLRLFDHVARFLQGLAAERGLLLFVDDLHWADHGTLSLIHYLLRRLRDEQLLILGAYREVELDRTHPLAASLVDWNRERLTARIQLGRLTPNECDALLAGMLGQESISPEFVSAIYRETEGNPFFVEEVIKSLIDSGQIYRQDGQWQYGEVADLAVPQSIKEAIGRRLNLLSPEHTELLQYAAVLGKTFGFAELAAAFETSDTVSRQQEDHLLDALDGALAAQLIRVGEGEAFIFTHDKIREVLYQELNPIRRRRIHQRLGEGLERLYEGGEIHTHVQDLAYHFIQSGDLERGLDYALRAAEQAGRLYAHDEALNYYQQAADCAAALNQPGRLGDIHEAVGDLQIRRGLFYPAVDAYQQSLPLATSEQERAVLKTRIGTAYAQIGDERGLEFLLAAQDDLDPVTQTDELAYAVTMLGRYHHYHGQHSQAIAHYERARELAEPLDDASILFYIYGYLAGAYQHLARFEESMKWARLCIALGERKVYPLAEATGYEFISEDLLLIGKWREALEYAQRDHEIGERIGSQDRVAWSGYVHASGLYGLGHLEKARNAAQAYLALAERIGEKRLMIWLSALLGFIETDLDADETARASAEGALAWADEMGEVSLQCWSLYACAYLHVKHREWEAAVELCERGRALYAPTENRLAPLFLGAVAAEAYWGAGRLDEAAQQIADHLLLTRQTAALHYEALGLRAQGQILTTQQHWKKADRAFEAAIAIFADCGNRLELGRTLYHRSILRQTVGQIDLASADAAQAHALFEVCGAPHDVEKARGLLDALG